MVAVLVCPHADAVTGHCYSYVRIVETWFWRVICADDRRKHRMSVPSQSTELAYWRPTIAAHDYSLAVIDAAYNLTKVLPVTTNG